ncbi:MAG TPA: S9 family peptidase [Terracidiphilus sp.]|nr:S9 family peptidase [Terracidiphilus sp.]
MFLPSLRKSLPASLAAGLFLCSAFTLVGQDSQAASHDHTVQVLRSLNRGRYLGQVAVSPDGKRLAWIQGAHEGAEIRVAPLDNLGKSERITAATTPDQRCSESDLTWSPNSAALAFLSDCLSSGDQTDLYLSHLNNSPARRLTMLRGYVGAPAFSPDGKAIAFLYVEGATRPAGALAAMKPPSGIIGEDGVEIQRVAVAKADAPEAAEPTFATPANLHVYEFDWSPDSKSLAYVAADPPGENNWWVAKLYSQRLGGEPKAILAPADVPGPLHSLQIAVPRWSPDGKAIAFIGGLMSDQGVTGGDVWMVSATGGEPHNLTRQRPSSPAWIVWDGNRNLFFSEIAGANCQLVRLRLEGDGAGNNVSAIADKPVFSFPGSVGADPLELSLSATADRSLFVFHGGSVNHPPEIYGARPGDPAGSGNGPAILTQLTHLNEGVEPAWGKSMSLDWTSDSFHVQGWLMFPKDYDRSKKYPLIVEVHGGPAAVVLSNWGPGWGLSPAVFSALGYFVLQPNPRGSYGQGEAFTQGNRKDFGYGDLRDILAGVDTVLAKYPVDPGRVGLTGWSYGGFMTMFAVTQTSRFKAAVAGAGISDWLSYYGQNSIDQWMIPYFGASVYDDPQVYAKSSAITFIKQARTPTLTVVGDRDGECPAPQSFEFWHALRDQHVPAQLVVYSNEGHGFADPGHREDVVVRAVDWFARYMPPAP